MNHFVVWRLANAVNATAGVTGLTIGSPNRLASDGETPAQPLRSGQCGFLVQYRVYLCSTEFMKDRAAALERC
jgi:hypothetical protein